MRGKVQQFWNNRFIGNMQYWRNLSASFLSQGVTAICLLIITPQLVSILGEKDFGLYGVLVVNMLSFCLIADLGFNTGLLRRLIHERNKASQLISIGFLFFMALTPILSIVFLFLFKYKLIADLEKPSYYAVMLALLVVVNLMALLFDVILQSVNKIFIGKLIRLCKTIVETIAMYIGAKQAGFNGILFSLILINSIYVFVLFLVSKKEVKFTINIKEWSGKVLVTHFQYSFWYFLAALAGVLVYNAQTMLLSTFFSITMLARFILITRFYEVVKIGLGNFTLILFPSISKMQAENSWADIKHQFKTVTIRMCILCFIAAIVLLTIGKLGFIQWSGLADKETLSIYMAYTALILLLIIEHIPIVFLTALKFNRIPTMVSLIQGIIGLVLAYLLIPKYGLIGAVFASIIALASTSLWFSYWYLVRKLKVSSGEK